MLNQHPDLFSSRHIGPRKEDIDEMLSHLGCITLEELVLKGVPNSILTKEPPELPTAQNEKDAIESLRQIAKKNKVCRSYIGMGYYNCITPPVIQRNLLENPGWYTQYTPYQAEISQES